MRSTAPLAILLFAAFAQAAPLHTDGKLLRDAQGAAVILRGVDATGDAKVPPFRPLADATLLDPLPRWGLNVVRLLFNWEAFEPQPGQYDAGYLDYYAQVIDAAGARGIYVLVDVHQDAFSRFSIGGCGEGFPRWALPPSVTPAQPDNGAACRNWSGRVAGDADLAASWDAFYADVNGVSARYLAMLGQLARRFAGSPHVIGYDLLNEPGGDEATQIAPLYEDAARTIRAVDPDAVLFVSPAAFTSAGLRSGLPKPSFGNFVYAPHFYDAGVFLFHQWNGNDLADPFAAMTGVADGWGVPLFVGELGAEPDTDGIDGYLTNLHQHLDAALASGAQWSYTPAWTDAAKDGWNGEDFSIVDGNGTPRANFRPRPFVRRIAGTPGTLAVTDGEAGALELTFTADPQAGTTELFVPAGAFGVNTVNLDATGVQCTRAGDFVHCVAKSAGPARVRLSAARPRCGLSGLELALIALCLRGRRRALRARR